MTVSTETTEQPGSTIEVAGIATNFHEAGSGDPVLLLHGSGPGVSAWANWQHTIPVLAERHRVLAPDLVGFGYTERPTDIRYSAQTWIDHVWGFLDAMKIERTSIVGNSLGGFLALATAIKRPELLNRMVLLGTPSPGMTPSEGLAALRTYEPSLKGMEELLIKYFAVDPTIITPELVQLRHEASIAPGAFETYRKMEINPKTGASELGIEAGDYARIATPTLVVHGREDRVIPVEAGINLMNTLPNADLHVFSRCGHWTQVERASEFSAVVDRFLSN
ncbi:2-hydroxy-6-oxo-2,4-heptadienoate hydrolase [Rhodococcus oxybenzonivorans]|uniref:2-hydroxy-6-oxo-2,4-heptadienoate hydrolase n=1 Tax=Rhodococcus oxybenzonivorans TaxID=1990687 RepID=A0A2S2BVC6_9NOCA|nr:alpha/beta hydrolase [Rhodococcus oxybenzonivorans]AWK72543.1 2-hydroxy-6-oxo-2,4-heptadienoate hydrolase [Rhodococcus oxybenzonivorans]